jgi:lipoate-protein ligase A
MTEACHVIIEPAPAPGAWNMAVDEALLEAAIAEQRCTLRWYQWSEPTLSLGYFQGADARPADPLLAGLPLVRRLSGGGAILHHHELTYSCAIPAGHPLAANPHDIYIAVHERIIAVLGEWGISAALRGTSFGKDLPEEAFLCFSRGDECDVVLAGFKVLGSAQRRRKGAILQHGSLVYRRSEFAPQFPGLFELAPHCGAVDIAALQQRLAEAVSSIFGTTIALGSLSPAVQEQARALEAERYAADAWNKRR